MSKRSNTPIPHEGSVPVRDVRIPERVIKKVPEIPKNLTKAEVFDSVGNVNISKISEHFRLEGRLDRECVVEIIDRARELLADEPNVLPISDPVTICGDIHGQYFDLLRLFEVGGAPTDPETQYLFLGDYVDRGYFALECVLLLFACKINRPRNIWMLRGNHESRLMTEAFTFRLECFHKYDAEIYDDFMHAFDCLPLAAVINRKYFCCHGGISPNINKVGDLEAMDRVREPPRRGLMCDILWADPIEERPDTEESTFEKNDIRGCSYFYGYAAVDRFLRSNKLLCIIRAHEVEDQGFRFYKKRSSGFPSVITVFSAPNFNDSWNNQAAILSIKGDAVDIRKFRNQPHPYSLPGFMDGFTWSLPFVAEKVAEMFNAILNVFVEDSPTFTPKQIEGASTTPVEEKGSAEDKADDMKEDEIRKQATSRWNVLKKRVAERQQMMSAKVFMLTAMPEGVVMEGKEGLKHALASDAIHTATRIMQSIYSRVKPFSRKAAAEAEDRMPAEDVEEHLMKPSQLSLQTPTGTPSPLVSPRTFEERFEMSIQEPTPVPSPESPRSRSSSISGVTAFDVVAAYAEPFPKSEVPFPAMAEGDTEDYLTEDTLMSPPEAVRPIPQRTTSAGSDVLHPLYAVSELEAHLQTTIDRMIKQLSIRPIDMQCLAHLVEKMKNDSTFEIKDHRYHLRTYKKSFVGSSLVTWLAEKFDMPRRNAVKVAGIMFECKLFIHVTESQPFRDDLYFYRFVDKGILEYWLQRMKGDFILHPPSSLPETTIERLRRKFNKLDRDNSGTIDIYEFMQIPSIRANPLAARLLSVFDSNGDHQVDFGEFLKALEIIGGYGDRKTKLRMMFSIYDITSDGHISNGELFYALKLMIGPGLEDEQLQQVVDKTLRTAAPANKLGITFDEFCRLVESASNSVDDVLNISVGAPIDGIEVLEAESK